MLQIEFNFLSPKWQNQAKDMQEIKAICQKSCALCLDAVAGFYQEPLRIKNCTSELSLVFTNNEHIKELNYQWRGKNIPTNVLSFPALALKIGQLPEAILGDIIFSYEKILKESKEQNKKFLDHFTHLLVHGLLHLLGFDHITEQQQEQMEHLERNILLQLQIKDPYIID